MAKFPSNTPNLVTARHTIVDPEALKSSGAINHGIAFQAGDVIEFPDSWADAVTTQTSINNSDKVAYHISIMLNGKPKMVPVGSFRRMPYDWREKMKDEKFAFNRQLIEEAEHDYERIAKNFGRIIEVSSIEKMEFTIWDPTTGASKIDEKGQFLLREQRLSVFTLKS